MGPVLCMITGGRHTAASDDAALVVSVTAAARAGAHLIQIREHALDGGHLARLVRACVAAVSGTPARIVVNDRLDVALATGAHGVHLRETSVAPREARAISPPGFVIGRSVHGAGDAARLGQEGGLDYLILGAVFPTPSKPGAPGLGLESLRQAVHATTTPVLAIGGVDTATAAAVAATGAAGLAAIRWWAAARPGVLPEAARSLVTAFAAGRPVSRR
jgi:thiamine-phosphate diphosphorylase